MTAIMRTMAAITAMPATANAWTKRRIIHDYSYRPEPEFRPFYDPKELYLGIELEVDGGGEDTINAEAILNVGNKDDEHIYIKHDGSLHDGLEIVSHPATLDYHRRNVPWKAICDKALDLGYTSHNAGTAGLHVHVSRLGKKRYCNIYPQYQNGDFFSQIIQQTISLVWAEFKITHNWLFALKNFEGDNSIPAMTIHKSKGLEFETVFVVGIEDASFFAGNHPLTVEDFSAFFVSVSRAKRNLYITTSKKRNELKNGGGEQSYYNVKLIYDALKGSGHVIINKLEI